MNNSEIAHQWASQNKEKAKGSNFFFEGNIIYSYGDHFKCGVIINNNTVLINSSSYSVSTCKHVSLTHNAVSHYKNVFSVPNLDDNLKATLENLEAYAYQIETLFQKTIRARQNKACYVERISALQGEFKNYSYCFMVDESALTDNVKKWCINLDLNLDTKELEQELKNLKELEKHKARQKKQRELNIFLNDNEFKQTIKHRNTDFCKIVNNELITIQGVRIALDTAKAFINALRMGLNVKGFKVDYYTVLKHDDKGVKIGCHFFDNKEIKRLKGLVL